eukprot:7728534-Pyramimonas_sp.AAC.1
MNLLGHLLSLALELDQLRLRIIELVLGPAMGGLGRLDTLELHAEGLELELARLLNMRRQRRLLEGLLIEGDRREDLRSGSSCILRPLSTCALVGRRVLEACVGQLALERDQLLAELLILAPCPWR